MNLSPLDIRKHEFKKTFRGFDPDEVMAFLDIVSMEYENLVLQNTMLSEKLVMTENHLKKYREIENTLQEALMSAERVREDTIKNAKNQADLIVREAEIKAASIVEEGRSSLVRLRNTFTELKIHKDTYLAKLKTIVNTQQELFKQYSFSEEKAFEKAEPVFEDIKSLRRSPAAKTVEDVSLNDSDDEYPGTDEKKVSS
ncbi:MAG: DivIVA domain-containing protein [Candidatus Latescibacter sp.]|nr:DivIVA domain-containing protein [Candidatus Latescibacter sp.]